ncbi:MAG: ABC transporter permease [Candidatus Wallbacteria bacterium]|nr:ABC transporter permease [Candidatus Wallbacteria bacterium]
MFAVQGVNPWTALWKIFGGSFCRSFGFFETMTKAIPLILISAGLSIAFRARFWNIGAEGQLLFGCILATGVGLHSSSLPSYCVLPLMFLAGATGGALWGTLPALLREKYRVNEVISTLMLNYIAAEAVQYLIYGPWKGKTQWGFPYTDNFPPAASLPVIPGTRIHWLTLLIGLVMACAAYFLLERSSMGFEIRVSGENPEAARRSGISPLRVSLLVMGLSGGLAGLAGTGELCGVHHHLTYPWAISSGYGFTAIIVAWMAMLNPLWCIPVSLLFAGLLVGGDAIQTSLGLPFATVNVFNGAILFFLMLAEFFRENKISLKRSASAGA